MAAGELLFVTVTRPDEVKDKRTQRAIRQRVMRDIGRSRRKQKGQTAITFIGHAHELNREQEDIRPALKSNPLPIDLNDRALELMHFMQSEADYKYRPFRTVWFSMALCDVSAFKLCMANAAMFLDEVHHPATFQYENSWEALAYYGQGVNEVTRRLTSPDEHASEGLMTTVLGFVCHDLYVGTLDRWMYHIQGLKRMVELRRGFHGLNANLQLFASWFDVVGSATRDTLPLLSEYSYFHCSSTERTRKSPLLSQILKEIEEVADDSRHLILALEEVAAVCQFVNRRFLQTGFWRQENDLSPLQVLGPPTQLLLTMPRFGDPTPSRFSTVQEMARVALMILLAGLKQVYELAAPEMVLFQSKLFALVNKGKLKDEESYLFPKLQIWALVTASLFQPSGSQMNTYTQEISKRMLACGFPTGARVLKDISNILWIECLADPKAIEYLISKIDQARSPPL